MSSIKKNKGFTLIEIVIVLAIAALILAIVFLAVSGAQRSRRDNQRAADVSRIAAQLENWASNHQGNYPTTGTEHNEFETNYLSNLKDPSTGFDYNPHWATAPAIVGIGHWYIWYDFGTRLYHVCVGSETKSNICRDNA